MRSQLRWVFSSLVAFVMFISPASAEQSQRFGDYVVHYNTLSTDMLEPDIAQKYNIKRSKSRAMLNISVIRQKKNLAGQAVAADVSVTSRRLTGHKEKLRAREIREGDAIYYISDFPVAHRDTLNFVVQVKPEGVKNTYTIKFKEQFFTE